MNIPNNMNSNKNPHRPINYINITRRPEGGIQDIQILQPTLAPQSRSQNDSAYFDYPNVYPTPRNVPSCYKDVPVNCQLNSNSRSINSQSGSECCSEESKDSSPQCSNGLKQGKQMHQQTVCNQTPQLRISSNTAAYSQNKNPVYSSQNNNDPLPDFYVNNRACPTLPDSRRVSLDSAISDPLSYSMQAYGEGVDFNSEVNKLTESIENEMKIYAGDLCQMHKNRKGSPPPYSAHILQHAPADTYQETSHIRQSTPNIRQSFHSVVHNAPSSTLFNEYTTTNNNIKMNQTKLLAQFSDTSQEDEYYGLCTRCQKRVIGRVNACQAMKKLYHTQCFTCSSCGRTLRGKTFYNIKDKIYCEDDYLYSGFQQTVEKCVICGHLIIDMILQAMGQTFHPGCFRCSVCNQCLDGVPFTIDVKNKIYCINDYHRIYAPRCSACHDSIMPTEGGSASVRIVSMDRDYHVECYKCSDCGLQLSDSKDRLCYPLNQTLLCHNCHCLRISS